MNRISISACITALFILELFRLKILVGNLFKRPLDEEIIECNCEWTIIFQFILQRSILSEQRNRSISSNDRLKAISCSETFYSPRRHPRYEQLPGHPRLLRQTRRPRHSGPLSLTSAIIIITLIAFTTHHHRLILSLVTNTERSTLTSPHFGWKPPRGKV